MGIVERKEREREQRREAIVDAAQKVFFEKGLLAATMDEIAEIAELSKGTLYIYYKSKEDLYLAVMMRGVKILTGWFEEIVHSTQPTMKKFILLGEAYTRFFNEYPNYVRMLHFSQLQYFHKQVSPEMQEYCSIEHRKVWTMVNDLFEQACQEGYIRSDIKAMEMAVILWSSTTALMIRIDNEYELWKEKMQIDLKNTLQVSNKLFWESVLTAKGKAELEKVLNKEKQSI